MTEYQVDVPLMPADSGYVSGFEWDCPTCGSTNRKLVPFNCPPGTWTAACSCGETIEYEIEEA